MKTEVQIRRSKFLSKHLRHDPQGLGLTLQPGGWVNVDDLLASTKVKSLGITYDELLDIVDSCEKQRFAMDATGDRIRANQGHSVEVDLQLEAKEPPKLLYHGTVEKFILSIMKEGLTKQARHHVHLSSNLETSVKVGSRRGTPVVLLIDSEKMHSLGYKFYESQNGVWLTDVVPSEFIKSWLSKFVETTLN